MNDLHAIDPGVQLQRLLDALDTEPPSEEEAREVVAAFGIDVEAMAARIHARIEAGFYDPPGAGGPAESPRSRTRRNSDADDVGDRDSGESRFA